MQRILEKLITPDDLSGNAKHVLCETADCLQALNINDPTPTNIVLQNTRMVLEESSLTRRKLQFQNKLRQLSTEKQRVADLRRDIQSARKQREDFKEEVNQKVVETQFLQHQIEEYKNTLEKLKAELQTLSVPVHHRVIQERVEAIAQMKNKCAMLRQKLEKYDGLPPNLAQAQELLAQLKQKHVHADQQVKTQLVKQKELTASLMSVPQHQAPWNFRRPKGGPGNTKYTSS
ncbi:uncharacterized protein LOC110837271 isoform X2 [Zootermopsis nevadensis]|nr:uncharacterized protein LOC110837271 isoform X2 [Zootermopsis nevadensis]